MKNKSLVWVFDLDGVISTNPFFFQWWTYQLRKNGDIIVVLSARNPSRKRETAVELADWHIPYDLLLLMSPDMDRSYKSQGEWKLRIVRKLKADIWLDNDFKVYEEVCGVDFSKCKAKRITI